MGHMFLVLIDAHSKWLEVHIMRSIAAVPTGERLKSIFAFHGIPRKIVTDNGPSFESEEFRLFTSQDGIIHITSAPYHPSTNGIIHITSAPYHPSTNGIIHITSAPYHPSTNGIIHITSAPYHPSTNGIIHITSAPTIPQQMVLYISHLPLPSLNKWYYAYHICPLPSLNKWYYIYHICPYHPSTNGIMHVISAPLAERAIQTFKQGLLQKSGIHRNKAVLLLI